MRLLFRSPADSVLCPREAGGYHVRGRVRVERNTEGGLADLQKAATDTGVRVENQAVTDKLSVMEQELNEVFSGPAPQQAEKRNRAAKTRYSESLKSQRSQ